jgi:hypothetical protein
MALKGNADALDSSLIPEVARTALHPALGDGDARLLPQELVVRKVHAVALREREVGDGHPRAFDLHRRATALDARHVARGGEFDPARLP